MKILYTTTIGLTMNFFREIIKELIYSGHSVDIACNETDYAVSDFFKNLGCSVYPIDWTRSPLDVDNLKAVGELKKLVKNNRYDIVHCHTPIAAVCTRLACRQLRKCGTKVVYTAHGFHFYKGAPFLNWAVFYPVEKLCSRWTDALVTINHEDYLLANKKFKAKKIAYVPGVGIDVKRFSDTVVDKKKKLTELSVPQDAKILLSIGELNVNKNHKLIIEALALIGNPNIHYLVAGEGNQKEELIRLASELHVNLHMLGYRTDVAELYKIADLYCLPSLREGLNVSVMEAMASDLPILCKNIRGNVDLVENNPLFIYNENNPQEVADKIRYDLENIHYLRNEARSNYHTEKYSIERINKQVMDVYLDLVQ